jgi:hypothetical protein
MDIGFSDKWCGEKSKTKKIVNGKKKKNKIRGRGSVENIY